VQALTVKGSAGVWLRRRAGLRRDNSPWSLSRLGGAACQPCWTRPCWDWGILSSWHRLEGLSQEVGADSATENDKNWRELMLRANSLCGPEVPPPATLPPAQHGS